MSNPRFARIRKLLLEAVALPADQRAGFLTEACGGDSELLAEIQSLLAHDDGTVSIIRPGAMDDRLVDSAGRRFLANLPPAGDETPPVRFDRYELREELGRGGMGLVYRAVQTVPIHREVALKLVREGLDGAGVARRFDVERQTLAMMEHPNIARVLDAGTAQDGRPFFVMELVPGVPLTRYCADHDLSLPARLRLMLPVCAAVQHAHQKGIIHRDLKPSNVLVMEQDGRAVPKVIDFGIAKALSESLLQPGLTRDGQLIGTLDYMSPEQARGDSVAVDARTDIYALGVMTYELVIGSLPHGDRTDYIPARLRRICEEAPRSFAAAAPGRRFDPDLETIVRKALATDPADRYAGAAAFAEDLERFLSSQPILARPPSAAYQLRKLVSRHRLASALIGGVLVLLVAFGVGMSVLYARSEANRLRALDAESEARQTADLMVGLFEINDPNEARGNTITAREILDRGAAELATTTALESPVQSRLLFTMGMVYRGLGLFDKAQELLVLAGARRSGAEELDADIANDLGRVLHQQSRYAAAESSFTRALAIKENLYGSEHPKVAATLSNLAMTLLAQARNEEALRLLRRADGVLAVQAPGSLEYSANLSNLGAIHLKEGRLAAADSCFSRCLALRESLLEPDHPELATACNNLAALHQDRGRPELAIPLAERALHIWERVLGPEHPALATALLNLAVMRRDLGQDAEAEAMMSRALAIQERALGPDHLDVALTLISLGRLYDKLERYDEADDALQRSLSISRSQLGADHPQVSTTLNSIGELLLSRGQVARAEAPLQRALAIRTAAYGRAHPRTALTIHNLGLVRRQQGRLREACTLLEEARAIREASLGPDHPRIAESLAACADLARALGETARADSLAVRARGMNARLGA